MALCAWSEGDSGRDFLPRGHLSGPPDVCQRFFPSCQAPGQAGRPLSQRDSGVSVHSFCSVPSGWWPAKNCLSVCCSPRRPKSTGSAGHEPSNLEVSPGWQPQKSYARHVCSFPSIIQKKTQMRCMFFTVDVP